MITGQSPVRHCYVMDFQVSKSKYCNIAAHVWRQGGPIMARTDPRHAGHFGGPNMRSPGHIVFVKLPSIFGEVRHFGGLPSFVCPPSNCNTNLTVSVAYVRD